MRFAARNAVLLVFLLWTTIVSAQSRLPEEPDEKIARTEQGGAPSLVLLTPTGPGPSTAQTSETRPSIDILVFNYSSAPTAVLVKAAAETNQIFARSGIDFSWIYCRPRSSPDSAAACQSATAPGEIRLRVLGPHLNNTFPDSIFGFAIAPTFVTVYYDSALRLVETISDSDSYLPRVLGCLIAHEIGHLLLGENQHAISGIMHARWDIQQMQLLMKGGLQFTPQQAMQMRINSRIRTRQVTGTGLNPRAMADGQLSSRRH